MYKTLLICSYLCSLPTLAAAEEAASVDEVVVTARKRAEPLSEVPLSMAVLSAQAVAALDVKAPADLEKAVPGFVFTASAYDAPVFTLRGVGFFNEALGAPPAVSVYLDQVPLPFSAMTEGAALDLARVEVLRGPQGVLFGQNATGGAVNFIPAQPTATPQAGADLTYGRFNTAEVGGYLSGPLSDTVQSRLAVRGERRDGFRRNYFGDDDAKNGRRDFVSGRLLTDWRPAAAVKLQLNLNGWIDRSDTRAKQKIAYAPLSPLAAGGYPGSPGYPDLQAKLEAYPVAPADDRAAGFDPRVSPRRHDSFRQAAVRADVEVAPRTTLTSISSYSHLRVWRPNDIDGTIYPDIFITVDGRIETYSQELRLAGATPSQRVQWLVGGNYEHDAVDDTQQIHMNGTNSGFGAVRFQGLANVNDQKVETSSAFANLDLALTDRLSAQGGVRYTDRRDHFSGCLADPGGPGGIRDGFAALSMALSGTTTAIAPGACVTLGADNKPVDRVRRALNEDNVSFRTGLSWRPGPGSLLYGSVARGYKGGAFDTLPAIRPSQIDPVRQERVTAYEVGLRGALPDARLQADAAVFHYDYDDKQIAGYVDTGAPFGLLPALVSIPRSRVDGAGAEAHWRPTADFDLDLSAAYLETRVRGRFMTSSPLGGLVDIDGEAFPNAPKWQLTGDTEYRFDAPGPSRGFVGATLSYRSRTSAAFGGGVLFAVKASTLLDLRAGLEPRNQAWRLEVWGKNVTDAYYWTSVEHVEDTVTRLAGMPATWGVTLTVRR